MKNNINYKNNIISYIMKKRLLYKSKVEYADFCINHVEGCSHGCLFPCYAMIMSRRFGKIKNYNDWLKPKIVKNALELLDEEIPRYKKEINFVHLSFMTDPFMYKNDEVRELTLKIIEKLNYHNIKCTVLTKGIYPGSLKNKEKYGKNNEYGITLVSLNYDFKNKFEPFSAPYSKRIKSLKCLHDAGLKTWVSIEPYPTPNLIQQDLRELLQSIYFVDKIIFGKLNYNTQSNLFTNNEAFYEECANTIIKFCKNRGIDYHIKFGTQKEYNKNTAIIFEQNL